MKHTRTIRCISMILSMILILQVIAPMGSWSMKAEAADSSDTVSFTDDFTYGGYTDIDYLLATEQWDLETKVWQGTKPTISDGVLKMTDGNSIQFNWMKVAGIGEYDASKTYTFEWDGWLTDAGDGTCLNNNSAMTRIMCVAMGGTYDQIQAKVPESDGKERIRVGRDHYDGEDATTPWNDYLKDQKVHIKMEWSGSNIVTTATVSYYTLKGITTESAYNYATSKDTNMESLVFRCEDGAFKADNFTFTDGTTTYSCNFTAGDTYDMSEADFMLAKDVWSLESTNYQGTKPAIVNGAVNMTTGNSLQFDWTKVENVGAFDSTSKYIYEFDAKVTTAGTNALNVLMGGEYSQVAINDAYTNQDVHVKLKWFGNKITSTITDKATGEILATYKTENKQYKDVTSLALRCENGAVTIDNFEFTKESVGQKQFLGTTLELEGKIAFNFYVDANEGLTDDAYVEFVLPNSSKQTVAIADAKESEYGLKFTCQLAAKEMADSVTATLYDDDVEHDVKSVSIRDYADAIIKNTNQLESYTKATPLMKEMLTYGAYSQILFNYNTADLANKNYVSDDKVAKIDKNDLAAYSKGAQGLAGFGQLAGGTLVLESETTLRLFFTFDSEADLKGLNFTVNGKACDYMQDDNYYVVECKNITAKDLDKDYKVAVKIGNETKFEAVSSAMTFCYNALNNASTQEALKNASKALYFYNDAANCYMQGKTVTLADNYNVISGALSDSSVKGFGIQDGKLVSSIKTSESKAVFKQSIKSLEYVSVDVYPGTNGKFGAALYLGVSKAQDAGDKIWAEGLILDGTGIYGGSFPKWVNNSGYVNFETLFTNGVEPVKLEVNLVGQQVKTKVSLLSDPSKSADFNFTYNGDTNNGTYDLANGQVGLRLVAGDDSLDNFTVKDSAGERVVTFDNSNDLAQFDFYQAENNVKEGIVAVEDTTLALHKTEKFINGRFSAELNTYKANKAAGIVFGADEDGTNYYLYRLTADRFVELVKVQNGTETVLDRGFLSAGHWFGSFNRLEVVREGNNIYCYYYNQFDIVNCYAVCEDAEPLTGTGIGLWAETPGVSYRNVTVSHPREVRKADVLIFGHSYTEMWTDFETYFPEYESIDDIGIGGSTAKHWEDLADEVIAYEPKLGIFDIGINELGAAAPKDVVKSIENTLLEIKSAIPEFEVVLVSVSHCPARQGVITQISETNARMRSLVASYNWMSYSEAEYLFCTDKKDPTTADAQYFISDKLHPSAAGYQLMANKIKSALNGEKQPVAVQWDFSDASQINDFTLTNSGTNYAYQGIADGTLKTKSNQGNTMKAVLKTPFAKNSIKTLSVDIIPNGSNEYLGAVVWLGASGVTTGSSASSVAIRIGSAVNNDLIQFQYGLYNGQDLTVKGGKDDKTLYSNGEKNPLNLRLDIYADKIVATLSLKDNPNKYVQTTYTYDTSQIVGQAVLHPWHSKASFDNLRIETLQNIMKYDFSDASQINDFALTQQTNQTVTNGILKTNANWGITTKAVLKTPFISNSMKSLSVDIVPNGSNEYLGAVVWLGASGVNQGTSASSVAIRIGSSKGNDLIQFQYGLYNGQDLDIKGGKDVTTLYSNGEKKPLTLKVDIYPGRIVATLSLKDNPNQYVQTTYTYDTSQIVGQAVLHPWHSAASFDNLKIETLQNIMKYDFSDASQINDFALTQQTNQAVTNGILKTNANWGITTKAVLKTPFISNSMKSLSVDIVPNGSNEYLGAVVWLGASGVNQGTSASSVAIRIGSSKGNDLIQFQYGLYNGQDLDIKGGKDVTTLYSNGEKNPLNLRLDIYADKIVATLSLKDNPNKYVQTTYTYDTSQIVGQAVLHPWHSAASFDNLVITYLATEE